MASRPQLEGKLVAVMSKKVKLRGSEPPRLVRANSAFAKAKR